VQIAVHLTGAEAEAFYQCAANDCTTASQLARRLVKAFLRIQHRKLTIT
jgi:hypothetical protein